MRVFNIINSSKNRQKHLKNTIKCLCIFLFIALSCTLLVSGSNASSSSPEPGSHEDPIVTKSYVDLELGKLSAEINTRLLQIASELKESKKDDSVAVDALAGKVFELAMDVHNLNKQVEDLSKFARFKVVELEPGQIMTLGESAEIILRAGKALAIAGEKGDGLADITTDGVKNNLVTNDIVPLNHLLLISRDDGRGIRAVSKVWVLVKGDYTIEDSLSKEEKPDKGENSAAEGSSNTGNNSTAGDNSATGDNSTAGDNSVTENNPAVKENQP